MDELHEVTPEAAAPVVYLGECVRHGWHGRNVCPLCREEGQITLLVRSSQNPGHFHTVQISQSLVRFRGGGREKIKLEGRCRMCLRPRGPDSRLEWDAAGGEFGLGARPLTRHHLIPERWFKGQLPPTRALRSSESNIVPLCRPCHDGVEIDVESRRMLRRVLGPDEVSFMIQLAGAPWVAARYPTSQN